MSTLFFKRLLGLPTQLAPETAYLTKSSKPGFLNVTVTGDSPETVLKTVGPEDVDQAIDDAFSTKEVSLSHRTDGFSTAGRYRNIDPTILAVQAPLTGEWTTVAKIVNDADKVVWAKLQVLAVHNSMASWWDIFFSAHIRHRTSEYSDIYDMKVNCTGPVYEQTSPGILEFRLQTDGPTGSPDYLIQVRNNGFATQVYLEDVTGTGVHAIIWDPDSTGVITPPSGP